MVCVDGANSLGHDQAMFMVMDGLIRELRPLLAWAAAGLIPGWTFAFFPQMRGRIYGWDGSSWRKPKQCLSPAPALLEPHLAPSTICGVSRFAQSSEVRQL